MTESGGTVECESCGRLADLLAPDPDKQRLQVCPRCAAEMVGWTPPPPPHVLGDMHCTHGCAHSDEEMAEYLARPEIIAAGETFRSQPGRGPGGE